MTLLLALCLLALWLGSRLGFRRDLTNFQIDLPREESPIPPETLRELAGGDRLAIVLESDDSIATGDVARVFDFLATRLAATDGVRRVEARPSTAQQKFLEEQYPKRVALYLAPGALVVAGARLSRDSMEAALANAQRDPLNLLRLAAQPMRAWLGVSRLQSIDGFVALTGARKFFLIVEPAPTTDEILPASRLVASIEQTLEQARHDRDIGPLLRDRRLYPVGLLVSRVAVAGILQRDGTRVALASGVLVFVLLTLFFRRMVAPIVVVLTVMVGLLLTAAAAALGYGTISLLSWMFAGLLVGLGDDYSVHVCAQYWIHGDPAATRESALSTALIRPGRGIVISALTSAGGFLALTLIPYPYAREVGILTAVGLMAIMLCSFTVLPFLLSFTRPSTVAVKPARPLARFLKGDRPPSLLGALPWIVLVGGAIAVLPTLQFDAHPWRPLLRGNRDAARMQELSREAGTSLTPILILSTGATDLEALARDREAVRRLQPAALRAGVGLIQSLAQWFPDPKDQRTNLEYIRAHADQFSSSRVRRDFATVVAHMQAPDPSLMEEYLPRILTPLESLPHELTLDELRTLGLGAEVDRHLVDRGDAHIAVSYVYLRQFPWEEGVMARFMDVARDVGLTSVPGVSLAGLRQVESGGIKRSVATASLAAALVVLAILFLEFRSVGLVLLCTVPLVCGLSASLLLMRLLGIQLNLLTAAIAPMLIGIGADDGIQMVERLRAGQGITTVLHEAGSSMIMTTLTTAGAFGCLALATLTGVREAGLLGAVGLLASLLASLHLVPLGWGLLGRPRPIPFP